MAWSIGSGLEGKAVIVTGASGAIGRELARAFAKAGAKVGLVDLNADEVNRIANGLEGKGHVAMSADLRKISALPGLADELCKQLGGLDVLVNTAGLLIRCADLDEVTEADWDAQHDVNLKATFFLSRAAAGIMREQKRGGRVINYASQAWWTGSFSTSVAYAATKGGVVSLTRGFARNYAKDRITFNAVAPGAIDTDMMRSGLTDQQLDAMTAQIPLGYMAPPTDLAGGTLFLASDHASYITGTVLNVSGGWLMY